MGDNYNVRFENLPHRVRGFTMQNEYGDKCVVLNSRLNREMNKRAYDHELDHINNDDFNGGFVRDIEHYAHFRNK